MKRLPAIFAGFLIFGASAALAAAPGADVFGSHSLASRDLSAVPQWTDALKRMEAESRALQNPAQGGACPGLSASAWCAALTAAKPLPPERQLYEINRFVNALLAKGGAGVPAAGEPWPGLADALHGRGGSLAAALTKYLSLREVGFPAERLRVVVAEDVLRGSRTALLVARNGGNALVLAPDTDALHGAAKARNLRPDYSFNETTLWMHIPEPQETSR